jgi:subtilase family serine protease
MGKRKTNILTMVVFASLLTISPLAVVAVAATSSTDNSTIYYQPQDVFVQLPSGVAPTSVPYCSSLSLVGLVCYSPNFITTAYNVPSSLDGTGQTIVIVDAYGSPTIADDLAFFDSTFGISAPPSFTILCGTGGCPATSTASARIHDPTGWFVETSLDVEYAHAIAPGASIVLDVASTNAGDALNAAEATAISLYPGSAMSQSFGIPEYALHANNGQIMQAEKNYAAATAAGITLLASAGDSGATNGLLSLTNALFPSSDPYNTAVGGTEGYPYTPLGVNSCTGGPCSTGLVTFTGTCSTGPRPGYPTLCTPAGYGQEQVWNEPPPIGPAATGGAPSLIFGIVPSYQSGLGLLSRTTPDVSYNAAVNGGVLVYTSFAGPHWYVVGGTSAGSPQWAGIVALVNQARAGLGKDPIGFLNPVIYGLTSTQKGEDFHDITIGNNILGGTTGGFFAGIGWDDASGWGTPNVSNFVTDLAAAP